MWFHEASPCLVLGRLNFSPYVLATTKDVGNKRRGHLSILVACRSFSSLTLVAVIAAVSTAVAVQYRVVFVGI